MKTIDEIFLIAKAKRGGKAALGLLIERYYDNIYKYIVRRTGNAQIAPDLTQDVFLKLTASIGGYKLTGKFLSYIPLCCFGSNERIGFRIRKSMQQQVIQASEAWPSKRLISPISAMIPTEYTGPIPGTDVRVLGIVTICSATALSKSLMDACITRMVDTEIASA